jgi:ribosomal protein S7
MVENLNLNAEPLFSSESKGIGRGYEEKKDKKPSLKLCLRGSADFNKPVIKIDYAGLLAKVVKKLAKKGKHAKGEETLLKALKKVDLSRKKITDSGGLKTLSLASLEKSKSALRLSSKSINQPKLTEGDKNLSKGRDKEKQKVGTDSKVVKKKSQNLSQKQKRLEANYTRETLEAGGLLALLAQIIQNAKPLVRLKKVRLAGITHQKPVPLTRKQAETEAIKRILVNARNRSEKSASLRLAKEFEEIYTLTLSNKTLTEIRDLHKAADANKANLGLK